jgi:signal transduction histidine kinase
LQLYNKQLGISVQKMDTIIKDLNYILQIKKEVSEIKGFVLFAELVNDIKLSIENIILQERVIIHCDFDEASGFLTVKSYLYSIFYNLIINSIKYRRPGVPPIIDIKSRLHAKNIELVFSDKGLGIDLKRKGNEVFGLFKRFHYHIEGKGMGLFMTKTQVQTLGGEISVASELNKGTTFTISFPLN